MATNTTSNYALRYPDTSEQPNGPLQLEELAEDTDAALQSVQDLIITPQIVQDVIAPDGSGSVITVTLGWQPQKVDFVCNVTGSSSNVVLTLSHGGMGYTSSGTFNQFLTGVRSATGVWERRTVLDRCAGVMIDDTTIQCGSIGAITGTGFTVDPQDTSSSVYFFWTAYQ